MDQKGNQEDPKKANDINNQQAEVGMSRAQFNAANEKLIEDQLQVSEDKLFDYVPGEDK
ncbi:hypothetical protein [Paenibacillus foliorum]|uniref:hypothetical protein n=1 Tax=Paenibacillus foliorum TaxID=2654974 RepID=UPI0014926500|nr:hypothetical protein [Paenibacillus foliorum]